MRVKGTVEWCGPLEMLNRLAKQNNKNVSIGHFAEQGIHPGSEITYVELMQLHHTGNRANRIPVRDILGILFRHNTELVKKDRVIRKAINAFMMSQMTDADADILLDAVGKRMAKKEKDIFGKTPPLAPNSKLTQSLKGGRNTPMVDTGELKSKVRYKKSTKNTLEQ